jgi:hypothetical protein
MAGYSVGMDNEELRQVLAELRRRTGDYTEHDVIAERERLTALWRAAHPAAAIEPASYLHPLMQIADGESDNAERPERWANDIYNVAVRRWSHDLVFGTRGGTIQIGIDSHDGTARHNWRDFQAIKNQLAGAECEAFELYPAESRLLDPSNYYTIWAFPGLKRIKVGVNERRVLNVDEAWSPQRAFAKTPAD